MHIFIQENMTKSFWTYFKGRRHFDSFMSVFTFQIIQTYNIVASNVFDIHLEVKILFEIFI